MLSKNRVKIIQELADFWQARFCLQSYDIRVLITSNCDSFADDAPEGFDNYCHAATQAQPSILIATVWINPRIFLDPMYQDVQALSGLVAHEFFHIAYGNEVACIQEDMLNTLNGPDKTKGMFCKNAFDAQERLTRVLENVFQRVPVPEKARRLAAA